MAGRPSIHVIGSSCSDTLNLPHTITVSPIIILSAGTPYNITTGTVNLSGQQNSRPAFGAANGIAPGTAG